MEIIDLTAPLNEKIQCYPTDPPFEQSWHAEFDKAGAYVSKLEMGAHVGTHVDSPLHFLGRGSRIGEMPLNKFMGEAIVIDCPKSAGEDIEASEVDEAEISAGDIVLFRTGWEERSSSPKFFDGEWPGFTPEAMQRLIDKQVKAVGGDIASADSPRAIGSGAPAHKLAAEAGLPVFEALINLHKLVGKRFFFVGLPLKLEGAEASPIRAIGILRLG